jgi:hypothetical protein
MLAHCCQQSLLLFTTLNSAVQICCNYYSNQMTHLFSFLAHYPLFQTLPPPPPLLQNNSPTVKT